jgi:hypothetical protein
MSENFFVLYLRLADPPKSLLKRGTLILVTPFLRGARGDRAKYLILLRHPLTKAIYQIYICGSTIDMSFICHLCVIHEI